MAAYRLALGEQPREIAPLHPEQTPGRPRQHACRVLGGREEAGTGRLEEAVVAFRAALEELTSERDPLGWAWTQDALGSTLRVFGERETGTTRLEEAAAAFRAALEERTRERVPLDWATTQGGLGVVLLALGEREAGTGRLEEAVLAFRLALLERTRERVPLDWAWTQGSLGEALRALGSRETGAATEGGAAVAAFRAALEERTRERVPARLGVDARRPRQHALDTRGAGGRHGTAGGGGGGLSVPPFESFSRSRDPLWLGHGRRMCSRQHAPEVFGERENGHDAAGGGRRRRIRADTGRAHPRACPARLGCPTRAGLGVALLMLGEREAGTGRLEEAVGGLPRRP